MYSFNYSQELKNALFIFYFHHIACFMWESVTGKIAQNLAIVHNFWTPELCAIEVLLYMSPTPNSFLKEIVET